MLLLLIILPLARLQSQPVLTFEDYFQFGKNEYTAKNWPDCAAFMKRAIDDFRQFEDEVASCRQKCDNLIKKPIDETLKIAQYHQTSQVALCLTRCRRNRFDDSHPGVQKMSTYFDMMERKPYQYVHICYWMMGELGMAVQSAYTFLVANPTDKDVLASLKFYQNQHGFTDAMLIDMERKEYESRFINGVEAYDEHDWQRCTHQFETSLEKSVKEDEKCRALCADKIDWTITDANPEIEVLEASIRASIVRCQHNCLYKLGRINGHYVGNLFAAHFEYLHFCQFKLLRGTEAAESVANYLLFDDSPLMRRNKYFYSKHYNKPELFQPSQKVVEIYKQRETEKRYLNFVETRFQIINNELPPEQADDHNPLRTEDIPIIDDFPYDHVTNLITPHECRVLRSVLPTLEKKEFQKELSERIGRIWKDAKMLRVGCGGEVREAQCDRPIVLSTEEADCGQWLGKWFSGCAVEFCDVKEHQH